MRQVPVVEVLEVMVWDSDPFANDKCLGVVEIDIAEDVAKVPGGRIYKTWYLQVCVGHSRSPPFGNKTANSANWQLLKFRGRGSVLCFCLFYALGTVRRTTHLVGFQIGCAWLLTCMLILSSSLCFCTINQ